MKTPLLLVSSLILSGSLMASAQEAPMGAIAEKSPQEQKALDALKGTITGRIVWSTSRANTKHDIWIMNADGTDQKPLTAVNGLKPNNVDWFPRFSPDGSRVLFVRSKMGWVSEGDAYMYDKWDLWTINTDRTGEKMAAESACWGTWRPSGDSIVFARGPKVLVKSLATGEEKEIFDAERQIKKGAYIEEPNLSPNGRLLALTIRGTKRETGIWNFAKAQWHSTGGGCEIDWFPSGKSVVRMNEGQGNGGTEELKIDVDSEGAPLQRISGLSIPKEIRFMDLPGRRSHEYFPKIDNSGQWMVWGASLGPHEHDIADYEIYVWKIGTEARSAMRLTFHTGNDRWPDLYTQTASQAPAKAPAPVNK